MSSHSPMVTKSTIKQAKADFKARGRPTLSALEQRQLERSVQLDRRAWGVKEREKRKAEATRKRTVEAGRREQGERESKALRGEEGSRRCDRFGYLSSQLHLGAFLGGGVRVQHRKEVAERAEKVEDDAGLRMEEEESFGDSGVDDETLINALASPKATKSEESEQPRADSAVPVSAPSLTAVPQHSAAQPPPTTIDEPSDFWDELGSGTQIARELASEETAKPPKSSSHRPAIRTATTLPRGVTLAPGVPSKAPPKSASDTERDRKLMPPPMMNPPPKPLSDSRQLRVSRPPPSIPDAGRPMARAVGSRSKPATNATYFTKMELETFVDEALQLTQVVPG
ncbi:hypothetical protein LTR02_009425 [Friedmanniomyces endolithicus]|nr:hypothetical protein LTR94_018183 [Friedmanniomyces endolithicus]KAK0787835.1 hypothetical protein LTR38_011535 [Friedmanniomyces endolithicus]KAK0805490.1 hypothetical protein LTR59_004044 [Friedmanniomyces endolithicus]KAK0818330.1 hypothetical protein LTR75_002643 [Friedmanniomyces endolithicus]KAK0856233.1 hypothetical protein LTR03_001324 [Friedmanniomyces endolithicus]